MRNYLLAITLVAVSANTLAEVKVGLGRFSHFVRGRDDFKPVELPDLDFGQLS